jgi:hypothetical protein
MAGARCRSLTPTGMVADSGAAGSLFDYHCTAQRVPTGDGGVYRRGLALFKEGVYRSLLGGLGRPSIALYTLYPTAFPAGSS